ncbi:MAG: hypothetical protein O7E52_24545 [Candidatus Poribacteria bacterium]|nr:hypothetical protein [Candidatus Poribacteria bacterium]
MAVYFFDSSAIVKRYVSEMGTTWVGSICRPTAGNDIYAVRLRYVNAGEPVSLPLSVMS